MKYNKYIDRWFEIVEKQEIKTCKEQKQLVSWLKKKLDTEDIVIKHEEIEKAIVTKERYFNYKLLDWEKFLDACEYGLYYKDGSLVFNEFFILGGRGFGKNGYVSTEIFYQTTKQHGIKNYDIDIIATSETQAKTSFNDVHELINENPRLKEAFDITLEEIKNKTTKSTVNYNTSNSKTKDGRRPGHVFFDEIHAYEDYKNIKVHTSGGGKKPNWRVTYITTDGDIRGGVIDDYKKEAQDVFSGIIKKTRTLFFICKLDDEKEVEDSSNWIKANPSLNEFKGLFNTMVDEFEKAQLRPSLFHEFMTKRMNIPHQDETRAVAKWEDIEATNQTIPDLANEACIGGIDYASVRDFCGVGLLFKKDGKKIWISHTFINRNSPHLKLIKKEILEEADEKGEITWVSTPTIPPEIVGEWFFKQMTKYNMIAIALDKVKANYFIEAFENIGFSLRSATNKTGEIVIVRSGEYTDTMVYGILEDWFSNHNLIFGDSTLMRWYVNNTAVEPRKNGNKVFIKIEQQSRKNDGFMAFTHAVSIQSELKETQQIDTDYLKKFLKSY